MREHGGQSGTTLMELVVVLAVAAILAAVAVPGVGTARRVVAGAAGVQELALLLRWAQAQAQSCGTPVRVVLTDGGRYNVTQQGAESASTIATGDLGVDVWSNFPLGAVEFVARGWPCLPGSDVPRAGRFRVAGGGLHREVVVQLGGCIRCE